MASQTADVQQQQMETSNKAAAVDDESWLQDDDFIMYKFNVALCNKQCDHDWDMCPYAHIGERTCRRRDPARVNYTSLICVGMMEKGRCPRGRSCTAAHTIYEYWLHPHRYKTEMCKVGSQCTRRVCFFAHKPEDLRPLPPHLVGSTGGDSSGKYSLSATRQAAAKAAGAARANSAAALPSGSHPRTAFQQQLQYPPSDYASWASGTPPAGMVPAGAVFSSYMPGSSSIQQPLSMVPHALDMLSATEGAGWQQHQQQQQPFMAGSSGIIAQMQQLALTGCMAGSPPHPGSMPRPGGMLAWQSAQPQWPGSSAFTGVSHSLATGQQQQQQYLVGDSGALIWQQQQQQQQQGVQGHGVGVTMPTAPQMVNLQPQQLYQQQQLLLQQLLAAQNACVGKPCVPTSHMASCQPMKLVGPAVSSGMHPGQLSVTQGPWMI